MLFSSEGALEGYIRELIDENITTANPHIYALRSKKAVDIVVCRDGPAPATFFIEVKYHQASHGRMGFGSANGIGFQPEIVKKRPSYFEENMRWILGSDFHPDDGLLFVSSEVIRRYVSGGVVEDKHNNIQKRIFRDEQFIKEDELIEQLRVWLVH